MYHKDQVIEQVSEKANATTNKDLAIVIGGNLSGSSIVGLHVSGTAVTNAGDASQLAITGKTNADNAAHTAAVTKKTKNTLTAKAINAAGVITMQLMPGDPEGWAALGFPVTDGVVATVVVPGQVLHGSMSQSDTLGKSDIHHDPLVGEGFDYVVLVTKGDPTNRALYIDVTNENESTSKSNTTVTLPADYLNVNLFFIVYAHNTAGKGPDSTPFGGRKIQ